MKRFLFYCCLLPFFLLMTACVGQEQYLVLENRVAAIERENNRRAAAQQDKANTLDRLKTDMSQGAKSSRENYAELKYEVQQLKERFYQVQGQMEELQHRLGTSDRARQENVEKRMERLDNAISKNYEKVIALEKYMGFEPSEPGPTEETAQSGPALTKDTEDGLYNFAKKLFDDGDKENARLQFENFINKYPESKKADNARFWIADSYYAEKWFEKAILEYQKVLETYPGSNKAAAARLKQGYAFAALGETANARLILKELIKRHPDSKEAKYAREKLKSIK
ncbi:MAG: tol-pal system protein YbgF [Desulfobacter sp.]|nr:MAG: tol-pal system protein YbgF [Desulfobacter sp.]